MKSTGNVRFRSDHTSWFTPPVRARIRGTRSIASVESGSVAARTRRNVMPFARPASPRITLVAGSAAKSTVPAGSVSPRAVVNGSSASSAVRPLPTTVLSTRTAVGESSSSA
jgi:hypothetical protein